MSAQPTNSISYPYEMPEEYFCKGDTNFMSVCSQCTEEIDFVTQKIKEHYIEECREMFNDICIMYTEDLGRLVGCCDDGFDYYYIVKDKRNNINRYSMVAHCMSLKGTPFYSMLEETWETLCPKESEFKIEEPDHTEYCITCNQVLPQNKKAP